MSAGVYDFTLEQGTDFELPVRVPMDLTGYSARMQVRAKAGDPVVALSLTTENGGITIENSVDPLVTPSVITVRVTPAQTSPLTLKRGVYDLELAGPKVIRLLKGKVTIDPEVTV